jgi:hypothetical protein
MVKNIDICNDLQKFICKGGYMKKNLNDVIGYRVHAVDGQIGRVSDFYFDDHTWTIRYMVVETGEWINRNKVLLSPAVFKKISWGSKEFNTNLTKEQVRNSPDIDTDKPITRKHEAELHIYYGWPVYWTGISGYYGAGVPIMGYVPMDFVRSNEKGEGVSSYIPKGDPNLRSINEMTGYKALADNEVIGHIESFIIDDETWVIKYLQVNAKKLVHGSKLIISPHWIGDVNWVESKISIDLPTEIIKNSPEFDHSKTIGPDYEDILCSYYRCALK